MPDWTLWWPDGYNGPFDHSPSVSPDGKWIVFFGTGGGSSGATVFDTLVGAYNIASQEFVNLGIAGGHDTAYVYHWLSDTRAIIYTGEMPSTFWRGYSLIDVTEPNGLRGIVGGDGFERAPQYYENPPRFEKLWIPVEEMAILPENNFKPGPCRLTVFYALNPKVIEHIVGNNCTSFLTIDFDTRYYIESNPDSQKLAALMRFNPQTEEQIELFAGELEGGVLYGLSPNQTHIVVIIDNDNVFDQATMRDPHLMIYDLTTGHNIGEIETPAEELRRGINLLWVDDNILLLQPHSHDTSPAAIRRIQIKDTHITETPINNYIPDSYGNWKISLDKQHLLVQTHQGESQNVGILSVLSGSTTPITKTAATENYELYFDWSDNLAVYVMPRGSTLGNAPWNIMFNVRVPQS